MTYLTILEKLKILYSTILDFKVIFIYLGLLLILTIIHLAKKINSKKYLSLILILLLSLFTYEIVINYQELSKVFDDFMNIIFTNIYFPTIYVYIGTLIINLIVFITSILNTMLKKTYKVINGISFITSNILFVIILNIIAKNQIDIFSANSLYTNRTLLALLEISISTFLIWLLSLVAAYTISKLEEKIGVKKEVLQEKIEVKEEQPKDILEVPPVYQEEVYQEIPQIIEPVIEKKDSYLEINNKVKEEKLEPEKPSVTFDDILKGNIPVTYYETEAKEENYNLADPEEVYEKVYSKPIKEYKNASLQDIADNLKEEDVVIIKEKHREPILNTINNKPTKTYTIEDYKKARNMLNSLKEYKSGNNFTLEEAVTLSLINNYSVDDCIKFREILESNIN